MRDMVSLCRTLAVVALLGTFGAARGAERITLRNGFAVSCDHREALDAGHVRLYLSAGSESYMDVALVNIAATEVETAPLPTPAALVAPPPTGTASPAEFRAPQHGSLPAPSVDVLIQAAGQSRQLNVDLLRSVVAAESGGHVHAVSRAGAQGLMQLMPGTAHALGVTDSFAPDQNLRGGTDYLDSLLHRYHDDLALALAAYNAGPGAVDRYHGVPPYRETRLYVARIIREFNRRTLLAQHSTAVAVAGVPTAR